MSIQNFIIRRNNLSAIINLSAGAQRGSVSFGLGNLRRFRIRGSVCSGSSLKNE